MTCKLAVLTSEYDYLSHAQQVTGRFLTGYPVDGRWRSPQAKVVSMYVEQKAARESVDRRASEFGFTLYEHVGEALRCGGDRLAVDGVLMFGDLWQPCIEVFEGDGRTVPVYKGKHLADRFEQAKGMVETARRLAFPLLAGSSLPLTWRLPEIELPSGCEVEEALVAGAGPDVRDALEALQAMLERRKGGETGVRSVRMIEGSDVWKAGQEGLWRKQLLAAALSRSDTPQGWTIQDGRTQDLVSSGEVIRLAANPSACLVEYRDGARGSVLMLDGAIKDFTFAARIRGVGIASTQFLLTPAPESTHIARLAAPIEQMVTSGRAPYPVERNLLACGVYESCLASKAHHSARSDTPHLTVAYMPRG